MVAVGDVRPRRRRRRKAVPYLFLGPYAVFMVVFGVVPVVYAISLSLSTASKQHVWQNYYSAFTDFRFDSTVTDVATYLGLWLPSLLVVVFLAAFLLDARLGRISTALRIIFYLPASLAGTASVLLWVFMLDPTISPFKPLWHLFGVKSILQVVTPGNTGLIVATIALSLGAGGWIVIVFGALQSLPEEIMSAAKMDGCGGFRIVRYIKLPLLYRYAWLMMILSFATGTQVFVEPTILADTNSGFVNPTWSINQLSYLYAFTYGRFGVSAAISSSLFVLSLLIAIIVVFRTKFYAIEGR